ncbi:MAG: 50S ribosomal protein L18e [Candidatus Aenigmarchaeota archaeon]|nr:50S ribosomal protein L18e [Candidatus Aenigmarchaeota archaeon]
MAKRTGPTNPYLKQLIQTLKKKSLENKAPIWRDVAEALDKPTRKRIQVNVRDIDLHVSNGDTILVPGVVLSAGNLSKKVNVAAWKFSSAAKEKISKNGGECMTINSLAEKNPKGSNVKIIS